MTINIKHLTDYVPRISHNFPNDIVLIENDALLLGQNNAHMCLSVRSFCIYAL